MLYGDRVGMRIEGVSERSEVHSLYINAEMVAVLKKSKGQCTTSEKMLQVRMKIIAVACGLKEEERKKKEENW